MLLYSVIMFCTAAVFVWMGIAIYKGKTHLIHQYHQTKVTDFPSYAKAFGKAMFVFALAMLASGIVGLFKSLTMLAVILLFIGLIAGIVSIAAVQRKYNGGFF